VANRFQQRGNRKDTAKVLAMEALTSMCVCVCVCVCGLGALLQQFIFIFVWQVA